MTANMQIARVPSGAYTITSNAETSFARDSRLSLKAYGILSKVLSLNESKWHFSVAGLMKIMNAGETAIRSGLKELEKLGYLMIEKCRDTKGRFSKAIYHFYESAELNDHHEAIPEEKNPDAQNGLFSSLHPRCGFPDVENKGQYNPKRYNTNLNPSVSPKSDGLTDDSTKQTEESKKMMPLEDMLKAMGSSLYQEVSGFPLCFYGDYQSEADLYEYDLCDRQIEECTIPYEFQKNQQTMEEALKFLCGYSNLEEDKFKAFTGTVINSLAEVIHTGMMSRTQCADVYMIIERLNAENHDESLSVWMSNFQRHYSRKLEEKTAKGEEIRNPSAYLKVCAVNYLLKDGIARDPHPEYGWK